MEQRARTADSWVGATLALALLHGAALAIIHARPGLLAVVLWYIEPLLLAIAAAILLAFALFQSRRRRDSPTRGQLIGFLTLAALIGSLVAFRTYPSSHDNRPSDVRFRLPLDGPVTIGWGGPTLAVNYHAMLADQRWAYDLLVTDSNPVQAGSHDEPETGAHDLERTFRNDGTRLDDYYAYGRPVLAPAGGVVRAIHDGEPDGRVGQWWFLRTTGNHVILEVAPAEFLFIAHLQPGSIAVAQGDRVRAGQLIGRVGNSGNSSEPHVHLHLQDTPRANLGEGIPFYFHRYRVNGVEMERGMPYGGQQRPSRRRPGLFTGQRVEHVEEHIGQLGGNR